MIDNFDERDDLAFDAGHNNNIAPEIEYSWDD